MRRRLCPYDCVIFYYLGRSYFNYAAKGREPSFKPGAKDACNHCGMQILRFVCQIPLSQSLSSLTLHVFVTTEV